MDKGELEKNPARVSIKMTKPTKLIKINASKLIARSIACSLACLMALSPVQVTQACAPEFPFYVLTENIRPDLPLSKYADGQLGIVQTSYAKSYLCVAYRYFSNSPLSAAEKKNIMRLWQTRLRDSASLTGNYLYEKATQYLNNRDRILARKKKKDDQWAAYSYTDNINADAFNRTKLRQEELIKKYGLTSALVKEWQTAQDTVFDVAHDGKKRSLAKLSAAAAADNLLNDCRQYQEAALAFYAKDLALADKLFRGIAADKASPYSLLASYMVARTMANAVTSGDESGDEDKTVAYIESLKKEHIGESGLEYRQDLDDLLDPIRNQYKSREELINKMAEAVMQKSNERFGSNVGDLTYSMDEMPSVTIEESTSSAPQVVPEANTNSESEKVTKESEEAAAKKEEEEKSKYYEDRAKLMGKHDITDWLDTFQFFSSDAFGFDGIPTIKVKKRILAGRAQHAIDKYRKSNSLPWLVAAVSLAQEDLSKSENADILAAAQAVPASSPAYETISFYLINRLIARGEKQEAHSKLAAILSQPESELPPTARNLFQAQMLNVSGSADEYLKNAIMRAPDMEQGYSNLPTAWEKRMRAEKYFTDGQCVDDKIADDLNINLPLDRWLKLSRSPGLSDEFRARALRTTWLRAHLLNRADIARSISADVCKYYPKQAALIKLCDATTGNENRYNLAKLCLRNFGMSPYLAAGLERDGHGISEFHYYNDNFWVPLALSAKPKQTKEDDSSEYVDELEYPATQTVEDEESQLQAQMSTVYAKLKESTSIAPLLSATERKQAQKEALALTKMPPAKVFGEAVFAKLKTNPQDPELAEMLYRLVKLAKWSARTKTSSQFSHQAHGLLQARFKSTKWAKDAPYWY